MKPELLLSIWGAITGSFASFNIIRQWLHDRGRITVDAKFSIHSSKELTCLRLEIQAVNIGRRSIRISKVGVFMNDSSLPRVPGMSDERYAELSSQLTMSEHELVLFGDRDRGAIELVPDGGKEIWRQDFSVFPHFETIAIEGETCGHGYVMLTSGERTPFQFVMIPRDDWLEFLKTQIQ